MIIAITLIKLPYLAVHMTFDVATVALSQCPKKMEARRMSWALSLSPPGPASMADGHTTVHAVRMLNGANDCMRLLQMLLPFSPPEPPPFFTPLGDGIRPVPCPVPLKPVVLILQPWHATRPIPSWGMEARQLNWLNHASLAHLLRRIR